MEVCFKKLDGVSGEKCRKMNLKFPKISDLFGLLFIPVDYKHEENNWFWKQFPKLHTYVNLFT